MRQTPREHIPSAFLFARVHTKGGLTAARGGNNGDAGGKITRVQRILQRTYLRMVRQKKGRPSEYGYTRVATSWATITSDE